MSEKDRLFALKAETDSMASDVESLLENQASVVSSVAIMNNGDTAQSSISSGEFVYIRNHSTLAEGLYEASTAIAANVTLSSSNVTAVPGGGINALNSRINSIYSNFLTLISQSVTWEVNSGTYSDDIQTTLSNLPSGYTAIGVVGYYLSGSGYTTFTLSKMYINGSGKLLTKVRNNDSSKRTVTGTFYILCRKTS